MSVDGNPLCVRILQVSGQNAGLTRFPILSRIRGLRRHRSQKMDFLRVTSQGLGARPMIRITSAALLAALSSFNFAGCADSRFRRPTADDAGQAAVSGSDADGNQPSDPARKPPRRFQIGGDDYPLYSD